MNTKVKLFILLIFLIILVIFCRKLLLFDVVKYQLNIKDNKIEIKENYNKKNYYIEITTNENIYPFRIYEYLDNKRKIIKNIYFYNDESIECVLPIINNNIYVDMMCYKEGVLYDYHTISGENKKLDDYVDSIDLYNKANFKNEYLETKTIGTVKYNEYNNLKKTSVITTYRGLIINDKEIVLFENDVYNNKISAFLNNYYIIANYDGKYSFKYFYLINIETKEITKLKSKNEISYDSYIQGIVDNKIYLYDKNNEMQYEIDIKSKSIKLISNSNYIKYYNNKKWEKITKSKANNEIYFNYQTLDNIFSDYDYVKGSNDYYYLFKRDGIYYKLYRVDKNNINIEKFILDVPTTDIYFKDNYLYYIYKNKLYYYSDITGLKTIIENSELEFNDTIKYYIY